MEWTTDEKVLANLDEFVNAAYPAYGELLTSLMPHASPHEMNWIMVFAFGKWLKGFYSARAEGYEPTVAMQAALNSILADPAFANLMQQMMGRMMGGGQ